MRVGDYVLTINNQEVQNMDKQEFKRYLESSGRSAESRGVPLVLEVTSEGSYARPKIPVKNPRRSPSTSDVTPRPSPSPPHVTPPPKPSTPDIIIPPPRPNVPQTNRPSSKPVEPLPRIKILML
jgi:hypothetical protein